MSLTTTSRTFRRSIIILLIVAVIYYLFILLVFPASKAIYKAAFPPKDPATPVYGVLPPLEFEERRLSNTEPPRYTLDTTTGELPKDLPWKMTVYRIEKISPSFEKGKDAVDTAARLGFYDKDLVSNLKDSVYEWKKIESGGTLRITTATKEIKLITPMEGKSDFYPKNEISRSNAITIAKSILLNTGRLTDELYRNGAQVVTLGRFVNGKIIKTDTTSDAQIARIDFYRQIDEKIILGPNPSEGLINMTLRNPGEGRTEKQDRYLNFPLMETHERSVETPSNATYEIISAAEAWKIVKENKGIVASVVPENSSILENYSPVKIDDIYINDIFLAYYENKNYQEFLQPVYVFRGKYTTSSQPGGEIYIYYPAIKPAWIKKPEQY